MFRNSVRTCFRSLRRMLLQRTGPVQLSRRGAGLFFAVLFGLLMLLLVMLGLKTMDQQLEPVMESYARSSVEYLVSYAISQAVNDELQKNDWEYARLVTLQTDAEGRVCALDANMVQINLLKSGIERSVLNKIQNIDTSEIGIPMGTMTGISVFNGKGPVMSITLLPLGTVTSDFRSVFSSAGINQTRHQILIDVTADVTIVVSRYAFETSITTQMVVAETVIVGQVPDMFLQTGGMYEYQTEN